MRIVAALLAAGGLWGTSCGVPPPCAVVRPGLVVALAEAVETRLAAPGLSGFVPVRLRTREVLYGVSPGAEFVFEALGGEDIRAGDLFYLEERSVTPFRAGMCGISGRFSEQLHEERAEWFREFEAGKHREATIQVRVTGERYQDLAGANVQLTGSAGTVTLRPGEEKQPIRPGKYTLSVTKQDYVVLEPEEALAPIEATAGACLSRTVSMAPRFQITGFVRTADGRPRAGVPVRIEGAYLSGISGESGRFTIQHVPPDTHTVVAGDDPQSRSPYPRTYYPKEIRVGPEEPEEDILFVVPEPVPTRPLVIKVDAPEGSAARLAALEGVVYSQEWSKDANSITATVRADVPQRFRVTGMRTELPIRFYGPVEIRVEPGSATARMAVSVR